MAEPATHRPDEPARPAMFGIGKPGETGTLPDTEQLLRHAFALNPRQGYELLFRRFYRPLCSHAVRYVYAKEVAEDIVSDVFLNVWRNRVYESVSTTFQAYLFGAVRNRVLNYLRDHALRQPTNVRTADEAIADDPQQILQYTELQARIQATVTGLPPQCQRVFMLSRFEGRTHAQIAGQLGISVKTVETHLTKALATLRQMLAGEAVVASTRPTAPPHP